MTRDARKPILYSVHALARPESGVPQGLKEERREFWRSSCRLLAGTGGGLDSLSRAWTREGILNA